MKYEPQPIDVSDVELTEDELKLAEVVAENVHDVWAKGRIDDGWVYGPKRDDDKKHHPCLIPYDEFPESEKEYDRNTGIDSVKLMKKLSQ